MLRQHVLVELQQFVQSVTAYRGKDSLTALTLIRSSLHLLENLPAAREICFEYFALIAEVEVQCYVSSGTSSSAATVEDTSFALIQEALENLVCKGPPAWSPLIASWSLDLVGNLSDKYTNRTMSINEACNFWLDCGVVRGLLTLITICFRKLTSLEADACVETLLAAYQRYTPTFDWVVARVGGCFPFKVISQILSYCLKRFTEDFRYRFESEIGILEYLMFWHKQPLEDAVRDMLNAGFQPKKTLDAAIIPFLVVFTNLSDSLLQHVASVFLEMYNDDLRTTIIQKAPLWMSNKIFADMQPSLGNVVLRLETQGTKLFLEVAKLADKHIWCQDCLEYSLQELEQLILNVHSCPLLNDLSLEDSKHMLWQSCVSSNVHEQQTAVRLLLIVSTQHSHIYYQTISELLRKSYDDNPNGIGAIIKIIGGQYGVVEVPEIKPGLKMVLEDMLLQEQFPRSRLILNATNKLEPFNTFKNLIKLAKMQKNNYFPFLKPQIIAGIQDCLPKILHILEVVVNNLVIRMNAEAAKKRAEKSRELLNINNNIVFESMEKQVIPESEMIARRKIPSKDASSKENDEQRLILAHTIMDLLNTIEAGSKMSVIRTPEVLKLSVLSVKYFFIGLTEKTSVLRAAAVNRVFVLLRRLCSGRKAARTICLRELMEGALFNHGYIFGQHQKAVVDLFAIPENEMLLVQIQRQNLGGPNANRTVLHSGLIGRGLRPTNITNSDGCDAKMQTFLLKALDACCSDVDKQSVIEGYSMISLLLVEMVSPDVMYNGLPFPDEEFTKVTMERDLLIRRAFTKSPVLWALLGFIATNRPALCFSSVLLRALCATCLHQWRAKNVNKFQPPNPHDELMLCTKKLLMILAMGQLLPPPLSNLHVIIEHFEAPEIALLLKECVWNYLKDHVPSPALFHVDGNGLHWRNASLAKIPPQYVDVLRNLMQKKLTKLGQHYHQMFIMSEIDKPTNTNVSSNAPEKMEVE